MPKPHTFPTLLDEVNTVSISKLKEWGYLQPNHWQSGTIRWSRNGETTSSIGISVYTGSDDPHLKLSYKHRGEPTEYKVPLVTLPSNLGKGQVWYFICPATGKRCRKLYSVGRYFLHREAYTGCMYEKQTYSKHAREQIKYYESLLGSEKLYEELYSKNFKSHYAGKPTKRYLRLMKKINKSGQCSLAEIEAIYLK